MGKSKENLGPKKNENNHIKKRRWVKNDKK